MAPVQGVPGEIAELHETGGRVVLWLAGLHALIALWHQFVLKDRTLERMNPIADIILRADRSVATLGPRSQSVDRSERHACQNQ
jgi:cytochrome b561